MKDTLILFRYAHGSVGITGYGLFWTWTLAIWASGWWK